MNNRLEIGQGRIVTSYGNFAPLLCRAAIVYRSQRGTAVECVITDLGNGCGDCNGSKATTVTEGVIGNGCNPLGDHDLGQTTASVKCIGADRGHGVGNIYLSEIVAAIERISTDSRYGIGDYNRGQILTIAEGIVADRCNRRGNIYGGQGVHRIECVGTDCRHALGNHVGSGKHQRTVSTDQAIIYSTEVRIGFGHLNGGQCLTATKHTVAKI